MLFNTANRKSKITHMACFTFSLEPMALDTGWWKYKRQRIWDYLEDQILFGRVEIIFINIITVCVCALRKGNTCHVMCVVIRRQHCGVSSLLPPSAESRDRTQAPGLHSNIFTHKPPCWFLARLYYHMLVEISNRSRLPSPSINIFMWMWIISSWLSFSLWRPRNTEGLEQG